MRTTVQVLCMTCCERLSASDECGGSEATARLDDAAKAAGWLRISRQPPHTADVCRECAEVIASVMAGRQSP